MGVFKTRQCVLTLTTPFLICNCTAEISTDIPPAYKIVSVSGVH